MKQKTDVQDNVTFNEIPAIEDVIQSIHHLCMALKI